MRSDLYTAAQGLVARQRYLDVVANNIANMSTTGYRSTQPFFRVFNEAVEEGPRNVLNAASNNQPIAAGVFFHNRPGVHKETGQTFDLAIEGEGFFKVQTPFGKRYTRNGNFKLQPENDRTGVLVTAQGYQLLDRNDRPMRVDLLAAQTYINENGDVIQDGVNRTRVVVVDFQDKGALSPEEDTLLVMQDPQAQEQLVQGAVRSGYLETSNVNIAQEMINMIQAQRNFETNSRAIRTIDTGMNQTAIQGLGPR